MKSNPVYRPGWVYTGERCATRSMRACGRATCHGVGRRASVAAALGLLAALCAGGLVHASSSVNGASGLAVPHWSKRAAAGLAPAARDGHAMTYDTRSGQVILFGGKGTRSRYYNDLWTYTSRTATWRRLNPLGQVPPARFGHALVYDDRAGELLVFGGVTIDRLSNDLWAYRDASNSWVSLRPRGAVPAPRLYPSMVYDPARNETITFGGWTGSSAFNDTWTYNAGANRWALSRATPAPSARWGAAMAYDAATNQVVLFGGLFGGYDGSDRLNDTWAFNPATGTWRNLHPNGAIPPARGYAAMDYDAATKSMVLFGGFAGPNGLLGDTWTYNVAHNRWSRVASTVSDPPRRDFSALVYDQAARQLVLFGGLTGATGNIDGTLLNDVWTW